MQWKISISSSPQRHTLDELDTHRPYSNSHLAACVLRSRVPKTQRLFFPKRAARVASDPRQIRHGWAREPRPPFARPPRFELSKLRQMNRTLVDVVVCECFFPPFPSLSLAAGCSNLSSVITLAAAGTWGAYSSAFATKHERFEPTKGTLSSACTQRPWQGLGAFAF